MRQRAADYPMSKPVAPPPRFEAGNNRRSINWPIVGAAAGLAAAALVGLIVLCAERRGPTPAAEPIAEAPSVPAAAPVAEPGAVKPADSAPPSGVLPGPAPAAFAKGYGEPASFRFQRRNYLSADELSRQLLAAPEVDLDAATNWSAHLLALARREAPTFTHPILQPPLARPDLHGLPLAMGTDCQLGKEAAGNLEVLSRRLRRHLSQWAAGDDIDARPNTDVLRRLLHGRERIGGRFTGWQHEDAVPALVQVLQAENRPLRLLLVELLASIEGRAAGAALAQRALFDLSAEVREAAVCALKDRPCDEYRSLLLEGFRYPWAPVADHAAEALVALHDRASVPHLTDLLDEPDPSGPVRREYHAPPHDPSAPALIAMDATAGGARRTALLAAPDDVSRTVKADGGDAAVMPVRLGGRSVSHGGVKAGSRGAFVVREVVRVNHLRNCLLCHDPAAQATDPVRGLVPTRGQPLPPPFSTEYYDRRTGDFVRADVTYLRQDFSVPQPVAKAGTWPAHQRYDYLVRTRYPTGADWKRDRWATHPQREAVRWALRELGGG